MKIKIKRFDKSLPLPAYKSPGAAAMDVYARETVIIKPHEVGYVPLNIALEVPQEVWVLVAARTSTYKMGIMPVNGVGIGDADFKGDNDEYIMLALNFTDREVTVEKGNRIGQIMLLERERVEWEEVDRLGNTDRGKVGSTGLR